MQSRQWIVMGMICASFLHTFMPVASFPAADKIKSLPGQPQVSFQQFSGFITIDKKQQRALFYYFVEAERDPASKPLVLWLNGGPGCSSFGAGAFIEHGPFKTTGDNLVKNEYSWNKEANILYLESPAGVGFSYSANQSFYNHVNDEMTARDSLVFLQLWFAKFPEYQKRDFFIAGESYAGHYVPQLAQLIVKSMVKFNLKGIAIGNPLLEFSTDFNSADEYYWSHGLIADEFIPFWSIFVTSQMESLYQPLRARFQDLSSARSRSDALSQQEIAWINGSVVGDQDSVIPFTGTRTLVNVLAKVLGLKTTVPYRPWFEGKQVGGWTQVYGNLQLSFATIRGASHTAPASQPARSFTLFKAFLAEANMLYLESPAGVGFSYSANQSFYNHVNDEMTGHYVPQLAQLIVKSKVKFNLKGIAIGNPLLEFSTDFNSADEYYWSHGLIADDVYSLLVNVCNSSQIMRAAIRDLNAPAAVYNRLVKELGGKSIDQYNVIGDVCLSSGSSRADVCAQQKTDNITQLYDAREKPTITVVGSLVKSGIRALFYSGDQDSVIPFTGTRTLVNVLAKVLGLKTTVPYRPWFEGKQVGGWTQVYGNLQLSFATIRGASHTAPASQPARSFTLFKAFLAGKPLPNA
ncbi:Serine carboxypeptidase-like 43 [Morella rubra]|uniref:Carboxypeptidase n=1 Tax=Morella rubra TaxID=262757 RepID=A0A6A1WE57_9ROSI|nr:Serine carboxypeptidase-like 43 [Morella rubra]